jgi:hypothetical protein
MNQFPLTPKYSTEAVSNFFSKIRGDIRKSRSTTGINDTSGKFATSVNKTGGKFATGINDTSGNFFQHFR